MFLQIKMEMAKIKGHAIAGETTAPIGLPLPLPLPSKVISTSAGVAGWVA